MTDTRNQSSGNRGHHTMVVEVFLTLLHLLLVQQTQVPQLTIGELIHYGTSHEVSHHVVDGSAEVGTKCREENNRDPSPLKSYVTYRLRPTHGFGSKKGTTGCLLRK